MSPPATSTAAPAQRISPWARAPHPPGSPPPPPHPAAGGRPLGAGRAGAPAAGGAPGPGLMDILESLSVALEALRAHKLRSFLTMLGVIIGVAAGSALA